MPYHDLLLFLLAQFKLTDGKNWINGVYKFEKFVKQGIQQQNSVSVFIKLYKFKLNCTIR